MWQEADKHDLHWKTVSISGERLRNAVSANDMESLVAEVQKELPDGSAFRRFMGGVFFVCEIASVDSKDLGVRYDDAWQMVAVHPSFPVAEVNPLGPIPPLPTVFIN